MPDAVIYAALGAFASGMLLGLVFGPAKERIDAAYTNGFIAGMKAAKLKETFRARQP